MINPYGQGDSSKNSLIYRIYFQTMRTKILVKKFNDIE